MKDFVCKKCGMCCKNNGIVIIYPEDAIKISKYLKISPIHFFIKYCKQYFIKKGNKQLKIYYMNVGERCVFLDENNLCRINCVKPLQCKYGPDQYFLSINSQMNCIQYKNKKEVIDKNGIDDAFFVKKLLRGYDDLLYREGQAVKQP